MKIYFIKVFGKKILRGIEKKCQMKIKWDSIDKVIKQQENPFASSTWLEIPKHDGKKTL